MLIWIIKLTDTLIEQTKTKPQETLEFKMNKQMQTFSFSLPLNRVEKGKWLLAVTSLEATNSVFNITLMKTVDFQLLHQAIGVLKMVMNLITSQTY